MKLGTTIEEPLSCGGILKVSSKKWYIEFFIAPDRRHTPTRIALESNMVDYYISIWESCWAEGEKMMSIAPLNGVIESRGPGGLNMRVSRNNVQIGMFPNHIKYAAYKIIPSKEVLNQFVGDFRYAIKRAVELQSL